MKKLGIIFAAIFSVLCFTSTAFADSSDHVIKEWHSDVYYRADNVVEHAETITVDFLQPKRGIFRAIPSTVKANRIVDGQEKTFTYKVKIKDIEVSGAPLKEDYDNGFLILRLGDKDRKITGEVTYEISFTYDIGDDRVDTYDDIFYTLLGADNEAVVENFSFNVSYEKPLPQGTEQILYTGAYGSTQTSENLVFEASENGIAGYTTSPVYPGEAVTLYARLPEGYFVNERAFNPDFSYILLAITVILGLITIIYALLKRRTPPVVTVEFTAPDGISSAEVGYIIDNMAEDKDVLSLIIWFADKGYITIEGEEDAMVLHKVKDLPKNSPHYMQTFFNGIFGEEKTFELASADKNLYNAISGAKMQLSSEFTGERKLFSSAGTAFALLMPVIFAILHTVCNITATYGISEIGIVSFVISGVLLLVAGILTFVAMQNWLFASMGKKALFVVSIGACLSFGLGATVLGSVALLVDFKFFAIVSYAISAIVCLMASRVAMPTKYCTQVSGKLLGLKNFIEKAELERIKLLAKDDPSYFYSVLPYAYVFGLTDVWAKQFESLSVPPPTWYYGSSHSPMFSAYWLTRSLDKSYTNMIQTVATEQMQSGGNGGTSFGSGGGGFSGGGFGGGGSGSW